MNNSTPKAKAPGLRRVMLLLWRLYNRTPLANTIDELAERAAASHCKMTWEEYLNLKATHPERWQRYAEKRAKAVLVGSFPPQPWQFQLYRKLSASRKSKQRKQRPRFVEWAERKLVKSRKYKRQWLRARVLDRLQARLLREELSGSLRTVEREQAKPRAELQKVTANDIPTPSTTSS